MNNTVIALQKKIFTDQHVSIVNKMYCKHQITIPCYFLKQIEGHFHGYIICPVHNDFRLLWSIGPGRLPGASFYLSKKSIYL